MWELTGARPLAAPVPESSGQGAREGNEGPLSSTVGSPRVERSWRGISPAALGSAMAVELRSGKNERGRTLRQCEGGGVLERLLYGRGEATAWWSSIMSHSRRGSAGCLEVMRGECSGYFKSKRGRRPVWYGSSRWWRSVGFVLRKKKVGWARAVVRGRAGQAGLTGRPRPSGEGESGLVGEEGRWPRLGRKLELGQSSGNNILSNFIWNLDFWQTLKICTRRFRRNFDMGIFPKIF
jgi:hypothetical protein